MMRNRMVILSSCHLVRSSVTILPGKHDHEIRLLGERPAVEVAEDFPTGKAGDPQQQCHLSLVDPARIELGPMDRLDVPFAVEGFDFVEGVLNLFDAVEAARVVESKRQAGLRMTYLQL